MCFFCCFFACSSRPGRPPKRLQSATEGGTHHMLSHSGLVHAGIIPPAGDHPGRTTHIRTCGHTSTVETIPQAHITHNIGREKQYLTYSISKNKDTFLIVNSCFDLALFLTKSQFFLFFMLDYLTSKMIFLHFICLMQNRL